MKNELKLKPLAKSVLVPLGLTAAASATDSAYFKKRVSVSFGLSTPMKTLIVSNQEIDDIMKTVNSIEKTGLLIKTVSETI